MPRLGLFFCLLGLLSGTQTAFADPVFTAEQTQILSAFYGPDKLVLPGLKDYQKGSISLIRDHKYSAWMIRLQFSKRVKVEARNLIYHIEIEHHAQSQAVPIDSQCKKKQIKTQLNHPQWGPFLICSNQYKQNQLTYAHIYPVTGNHQDHLQISYTGDPKDLVSVMKSLKTAIDP
ncbi:MAG: hypothetical protein IV090_00400 [Candidatus Sericytochromatia bacterium]|nr:hypothetical protein [Candidatus Sericytochromatia bacterium]